MERTRPVNLAEGERYVPLAKAAVLLGAPSVAALRNRIYRWADPACDGFEKRGGRWFVVVSDGQAGDQRVASIAVR